MAARQGISGLAVGIAVAGGVVLVAGLKNATISDTLRALIKNEPIPGQQQQTALGKALAGAGAAGGSSGGAEAPVTGQGVAIANAAQKYIGVPYRFGGADPSGFDCSGLVTYVLHHDLGINLPSNTHTVTGQFYVWSGATTVSSPEIGDLVCWTGHIGIYVGGGNMVHAPHTGAKVSVEKVWTIPPPLYRRVNG